MEDDAAQAGPAAGVVVQPGKRKKVRASVHTTPRRTVCALTHFDPFAFNHQHRVKPFGEHTVE